MEVEVREEVPNPRADSTLLLANNSSAYPIAESPVIIVRAEEVLLVVLVLIIWVAAIALFFNRWGKIRMLEPYQPKFQQAHRPSCPLAPLSPPGITPQQRMSFSKYNVNCLADSLGITSPNSQKRPRQNSVFAGSSTMAFLNPPRRAKSAMDIQHMIINERPISLTGSLIPIIPGKDRRPSITIERAHSRHRPSVCVEKAIAHYHQVKHRRASCLVDRPATRHWNFTSFEQPPGDRKTSVTIERPSCSHQQPTISLETPSGSFEKPSMILDVPVHVSLPKTSQSFEQPSVSEKPKTAQRMATSLDAAAIRMDAQSPPIVEEEKEEVLADDRASPVGIHSDEMRLTAPLLEELKSSDV